MSKDYLSCMSIFSIGLIFAILGFYNLSENSSLIGSLFFIIFGAVLMGFGYYLIPVDKYRCKICKNTIRETNLEYCPHCDDFLLLEEIK